MNLQLAGEHVAPVNGVSSNGALYLLKLRECVSDCSNLSVHS